MLQYICKDKTLYRISNSNIALRLETVERLKQKTKPNKSNKLSRFSGHKFFFFLQLPLLSRALQEDLTLKKRQKMSFAQQTVLYGSFMSLGMEFMPLSPVSAELPYTGKSDDCEVLSKFIWSCHTFKS